VFLRAPDAGRFEYFKAKDKTDSAYRGDYYTLGDVGYMDEEGFLFLTDRSVDLIISGGVNVYPTEIDAVLLAHPKVADSATIGIPNDEWGEEVKSVVELAAGIEPSRGLEAELNRVRPGAVGPLQVPEDDRLRRYAPPPGQRQDLPPAAAGHVPQRRRGGLRANTPQTLSRARSGQDSAAAAAERVEPVLLGK